MSQDPNQPPTGYGSDPQNPYGSPPPQNPYGASPQGPYGPTPQPPPQNPYGPPPQQGPYGPPPQQGPYGPPPQQGPYGPPPQNPYGPPMQQGAYPAPAGFAFSGQGGYQVPLQPLPLGDAVQQLPNQYVNVVSHPAVETFAAEIPKSGWDITWIQLLIMAVGTAVIGLISALLLTAIMTPMTNSMGSFSGVYSTILVSTSVGSALSRIIFVPIVFFIGQGIQYLLAKAFKGQGTFLTQCYTNLLYQVPLTILVGLISLIFSLIPVVGGGIAGLLGFAIGIYSIVLNVFQLRAAHRLSTGQAVGVVLIPIAVLIVLVLICAVAFTAILLQMMHAGQG